MNGRHTKTTFALLFVFLASAAAGEGLPKISYHEVAQGLTFDVLASPPDDSGQKHGTSKKMRFDAFGLNFDIDLVPNSRLVARLRSSGLAADAIQDLYAGTLASSPGSWARISNINGRIAGVISHGGQLYVLDSAASLAPYISQSYRADTTLIVRASDLYLPINDVVHRSSGDGLFPADKVFRKSGRQTMTNAAESPAPVGIVSLGLVLAASYYQQFLQPGPEAYALSAVNIADGIFREQLGIFIEVEYVETFTSPPDPFEISDPAALIEFFAEYKESSPALAPLGLAHLFTRHDLDGDTVGIGQLASVCYPNGGAGVTKAQGNSLDGLIVAHEFGHNFGAPHDGEAGSACESETGSWLMATYANFSPRFSDCSLEQMAPVIEAATCIVPLPASELVLNHGPIPVEVYEDEGLRLVFYAEAVGNHTSYDSSVTIRDDRRSMQLLGITVHNVGNCNDSSSTAYRQCNFGRIAAGDSVAFDVRIKLDDTGPGSVEISSASSNDTDLTNNSFTLNLDVLPSADIRSSGVASAERVRLRPGDVGTLTARVRNWGGSTSNVVFSAYTDVMHRISAASGCMATDTNAFECDLGEVRPGEERLIVFDVMAGGSPARNESSEQRVFLEASSSLHDIADYNNNSSHTFELWGTLVDIDMTFTTTPVNVMLNETRQYAATLRNTGLDTVTEALISVASGTERHIEITEATVDRGSCVPGLYGYLCNIGSVAPGESVQLSGKYRGGLAGSGHLYLIASTETELDYNSSNNRTNAGIAVTAPPPAPASTSSGGGGVSGPGILSLLLLMLSRRHCRVRRGLADQASRSGISSLSSRVIMSFRISRRFFRRRMRS